MSSRTSSPRKKSLTRTSARGRKRGQEEGAPKKRRGGNRTGKDPATKCVVLAHDEVNELVGCAYSLSACVDAMRRNFGVMLEELDKLEKMCENVNDRLIVQILPMSEATHKSGVAEVATDEEALESLLGAYEAPPKRTRQLSFYDGARETSAQGDDA